MAKKWWCDSIHTLWTILCYNYNRRYYMGTRVQRRRNVMYTLGALLLLSVLLGAATGVIDSVLGLVGADKLIKQIPVIGAHWALLVAVLMVWLTDLNPISGWGVDFDERWMIIVANGAIIYGMGPLKDAVVSMVNKGLRA